VESEVLKKMPVGDYLKGACSFGAASSADLLVCRIVSSFFGVHLAKFATREMIGNLSAIMPQASPGRTERSATSRPPSRSYMRAQVHARFAIRAGLIAKLVQQNPALANSSFL
jgi:hypothetical protein